MPFAAHARGKVTYPIVQPTTGEGPAPLWAPAPTAAAAAPSLPEMLGAAARKCLAAGGGCVGAPGGRTRSGFFEGVVDDSAELAAGARDRFIVESMPTLKQLEKAERAAKEGVPLVDSLQLQRECREAHLRSTVQSFQARDKGERGVLRFLLLQSDEAAAKDGSVAVDGPLVHGPLLQRGTAGGKPAAPTAEGKRRALAAELKRSTVPAAKEEAVIATGSSDKMVAAPHKSSAIDWWESNVALIGTDEDRALRKRAAMTEPAWQGAGSAPGVRMWRVEQFKVVDWPANKFGSFHEGDSYVLLHTSRAVDVEGYETDKLIYNIHFWLGRTTPIDAAGTAAYKTVELDDLLDGQATHHREVMGGESDTFKALFDKIKYVAGGAPSGFRKVCDVDLDNFTMRLLRVTKVGLNSVIVEVPCSRDSLHHEAAFILDMGRTLYVWAGNQSSVHERSLAKLAMQELEVARVGQNVVCMNMVDDGFWAALGGPGPVAARAQDAAAPPPPKAGPLGSGVLYKLSESKASSQLAFDEVHRGTLDTSMLLEQSVNICDSGAELIVWMGKGASERERRAAMLTATKYLALHGKPHTTPIKVFRTMEDAMADESFAQIFAGC